MFVPKEIWINVFQHLDTNADRLCEHLTAIVWYQLIVIPFAAFAETCRQNREICASEGLCALRSGTLTYIARQDALPSPWLIALIRATHTSRICDGELAVATAASLREAAPEWTPLALLLCSDKLGRLPTMSSWPGNVATLRRLEIHSWPYITDDIYDLLRLVAGTLTHLEWHTRVDIECDALNPGDPVNLIALKAFSVSTPSLRKCGHIFAEWLRSCSHLKLSVQAEHFHGFLRKIGPSVSNYACHGWCGEQAALLPALQSLRCCNYSLLDELPVSLRHLHIDFELCTQGRLHLWLSKLDPQPKLTTLRLQLGDQTRPGVADGSEDLLRLCKERRIQVLTIGEATYREPPSLARYKAQMAAIQDMDFSHLAKGLW